jgi:phosphatidylglycerol:prolipoprotein diacylglycerol transferase
MIGIGVILAVVLFMKRGRKAGYKEDSLFNMAIIAVVSGLLGAKILYIIVEIPSIIKQPSLILEEFNTGFVFYGGIIFGILAAYLYIRKLKWPFLKLWDIAAPAIPLAHAFGRVGCFFAGCCYGRETASFIGMQFNNSPYTPHGVSLIPTQIISSLGNLMIFVFLLWFDRAKKKNPGQTGALYLLLYSLFRFIIEIFRDDPRGSVFNIMSTSQFICIFVFAAGIFIMYKVSKSNASVCLEEPAGSEEQVVESEVQADEPKDEVK